MCSFTELESGRVLAGSGIRLRLLAPTDRALYRELYCSEDVMRAIASPLTIEHVDDRFRRALAHNGSVRPGHRAWAIDTGPGTAALGLAALLRNRTRAELGIMLLPPAWRQRVATRAFDLLLPHAFGRMRLERIDASRADDGQARVIDRLLAPFGFERASGLRPGEIGWCLTRVGWTTRRSRSGSLA
jgi:ribosomal-protein-alanine N-acetyltransferase